MTNEPTSERILETEGKPCYRETGRISAGGQDGHSTWCSGRLLRKADPKAGAIGTLPEKERSQQGKAMAQT